MNFEQVNQLYSPFNQYSLFVSPSMSNDDHQLNNTWSPFSTPSISPYGSPPQLNFQYSSMNATRVNNQINNVYLPAPIGRPSVFTNKTNQQIKAPTNSMNTQKRLPKRSEQMDYNELMKTVSYQNKSNRVKLCTFCKSNGEDELIYTSHSLKSATNKISCPILMKYTCVECGATGENTHTIKYCPAMQKKVRKQMLNKLIGSNKEN